MNGFDKETSAAAEAASRRARFKHPQYAYVPHSETKPYFDMGKQYVLADECTRRTSTRAASSRISTSSPAKPSRP